MLRAELSVYVQKKYYSKGNKNGRIHNTARKLF
jgi:hypothetical protein